MWRRRSRAKRRRAVAGILAALMLFVMLFTVGTGYFLFVNQNNLLYTQSLTNRANDLQSTTSESLLLTTAQGSNQHITITVINQGSQTTTLVDLFVTSPSGSLTVISASASPPLPLPLNPGVTSAAIDTTITPGSGTYAVKVLTQRGAEFSTSYPQPITTLASNALSSGAIGDLYLTFNSYTFYQVVSHFDNANCPSQSGANSGYCFQSSGGLSGPGFAINSNTFQSSNIGFSITLTNLNPAASDIILDQFSLMYQTSFYGNEHENLISWFIVSAGTPGNGVIPILSQYTPVVLHYNSPVIIYYAAQNCVNAAAGPNHSGCSNAQNSGFVGCPCSNGGAATVFLLSNGWIEAPGSYTISSLAYSGTNYGQNSPFVSTLYY